MTGCRQFDAEADACSNNQPGWRPGAPPRSTEALTMSRDSRLLSPGTNHPKLHHVWPGICWRAHSEHRHRLAGPNCSASPQRWSQLVAIRTARQPSVRDARRVANVLKRNPTSGPTGSTNDAACAVPSHTDRSAAREASRRDARLRFRSTQIHGLRGPSARLRLACLRARVTGNPPAPVVRWQNERAWSGVRLDR